mmetsp:Transcript_89526/g.200296  ORF Transcript_89526/g.200296 Transcript_89526/m.200296 type:complete len:277 (-) Transcript_89526:69-899(-)
MARFPVSASSLLVVLSAALALASQPEMGGPSHVAADGGADDLMALIQHGARTQQRRSVSDLSKSNLTASGAGFDCSKYPEFCKEPFNCDKWDGPMASFVEGMVAGGVATDGKVNYQAWCNGPEKLPHLTKCVAGDLDGAGRLQFEMGKAGVFGDPREYGEIDASYCFMEGHCVNSEVTNDTTLDEAVQQCDKRFGRDAWAHAGSAGFLVDFTSHFMGLTDPANGFTSSSQTRPFLLLACAMGNYHCDVRYCQVTYCKDEYYVKKYGHYLKEYGWVK